jgi:hypothetical protein
MSALRLVTHYDPKPIPDRRFDWSAYDDATYDGEPGQPLGYGATEQEAVADLMGQIEEDAS